MELMILAFLILGLLVVFTVDAIQKRNSFLTKIDKNNGGWNVEYCSGSLFIWFTYIRGVDMDSFGRGKTARSRKGIRYGIITSLLCRIFRQPNRFLVTEFLSSFSHPRETMSATSRDGRHLFFNSGVKELAHCYSNNIHKWAFLLIFEKSKSINWSSQA